MLCSHTMPLEAARHIFKSLFISNSVIMTMMKLLIVPIILSIGMGDYQEKTTRESVSITQVNLDISEAPEYLLSNLDKMGVDDEELLNEYEISFLQYIFDIAAGDLELKGKRVYYLGGKERFFSDEKERFQRRQADGIGCTVLFVFSEIQKEKVHGYDMAVSYRPPMQKRIPSIRYVIRSIDKMYRQKR